MKKPALICAATALFLSLSLYVAPFASAAQPKVVITPMNFDFGTIDEGVKSKATFTIKNDGDAPLVIYDVRPTCGCTIANLSTKTIAPGKTATLAAVYNSMNASGEVRKFITVSTNDVKTGSGVLTLTLSANVKAKPAPDIALSIYMLANVQMPSGGSTKRTISVSNPGQLDLTINQITASQGIQAVIGGVNVSEGKTVNTSLKLKPGQSEQMDVTISPKVKKGNYQEVLIIRSNSTRNPVRDFIVQGMVQ